MNANTSRPDLPVFTVSQLNNEVRLLLETSYQSIVVEGEISNLATPASGHSYFSLKDRGAQIRCAFFRHQKLRCRHQAREGAMVLARGKLSLYEGRGDYQLIVNYIEDAGEGLLRQKFEQLKFQLQAEGLFDDQYKKPIPNFPQRIGVITSASGAAIRDVLSTLKRRYPLARVQIFPVSVQGDKAKIEIANMLAVADQYDNDVLILTRGGGSLEDLWAFNEEIVARAIFETLTPIVSGIGHEIDYTIADFIADLRAPTPTAAAELVTPQQTDIMQRLASLQSLLLQTITYRVNHSSQRLDILRSRLIHPRVGLAHSCQRLQNLLLRLQSSEQFNRQQQALKLNKLQTRLYQLHPGHRLKSLALRFRQNLRQLKQQNQFILYRNQQRQQELQHRLLAISPQATLERGYTILWKQSSKVIIRRQQDAETGDKLTARLSDGELTCQVLDEESS